MKRVLTNKILYPLLIGIFTFLAYSNIFGNGFVWDDQFFILKWEKIKSLKNLGAMLGGSLPPRYEGAYRPLLGMFYLLAYSFFGTNPFGYHLLSLAVHLINTVLVYLITCSLTHRWSHALYQAQSCHPRGGTKTAFIPFLTALLFGIHPIQTEAVTYIAASFNTIGITFFIASFYFYLKARGISSKFKIQSSTLNQKTMYQNKFDTRQEYDLGLPRTDFQSGSWAKLQFKIQNFRISASRVWYYCSIAFALLAFFTYEFTLTLPFLLVAYHLIFRKQRKKSFSQFSHLPYFLAAGFYLFVRIAVIHTVGRGSYLLGSFYFTMLAMIKVHLLYLGLLLLPINQSINHIIPKGILASHYLDPKAAAVYAQSAFEPMVIFSLIVLILLILTAIKSFKKFPFITFSIIWFYLTLAPALNIIPVQELMAERYLYLPSVGFFWVLALVLYSLDLSLLKSLLRGVEATTSTPRLPRRQAGTVGRQEQATHRNKTSPVHGQTPHQNKYCAGRHSVIPNRRGRMIIIIILATCYFYLIHQRNTVWQNSISFWSDAANKSPISEIAYYNLGNAYLKKENLPLAIAAYQQAIKNNPNSIAYFNLGNTYYQQKDYDKSAATYKMGLKVHPDSVELLINLAMVYEKQGKIELSRQSYLKALALEPGNEKTRDNLINLLKKYPETKKKQDK